MADRTGTAGPHRTTVGLSATGGETCLFESGRTSGTSATRPTPGASPVAPRLCAGGRSRCRLLDETEPGTDDPGSTRPPSTSASRVRRAIRTSCKDQCQHGGWYFRRGTGCTSRALRTILALAHGRRHGRDLGAALLEPRATIPRAACYRRPFARRTLPDSAGGGPNPLFVRPARALPARGQCRRASCPRPSVTLEAALLPAVFTLPDFSASPGIGGGRDRLSPRGLRGAAGPLENAPHGAVHVACGAACWPTVPPDGYMVEPSAPLRWTRSSGCTTATSTGCGRSGIAPRQRATPPGRTRRSRLG